ncbi:MAG: hypothetical protein E7080_04505 [Bacteroidales bacterium]|nr:hypothetical protein [Bacteroidales bacterium]
MPRTQEMFQKDLKRFAEESRNYMLAGEKNQITNLFEGDSLAVLNEEQIKILDYAENLVSKNNSIIVLPQELNLLIGDTTSVNYFAFPNWDKSFFVKYDNEHKIVIPMYVESHLSNVLPELHISYYNNGEFSENVYSFIIEKGEAAECKGTYLCSYIQGELIYGKIYKEGKFVCNIKGHKLYEKSERRREQREYENRRKYRKKRERYEYEKYKFTIYGTDKWDIAGFEKKYNR